MREPHIHSGHKRHNYVATVTISGYYTEGQCVITHVATGVGNLISTGALEMGMKKHDYVRSSNTLIWKKKVS